MSDLKSQCTTPLESSVALAADLSGCIQRNEVFPVFQPIVSLLTGRAVGCEVLLRWRHPSRGLVSPAEFMPIAEQAGVTVPFGEYLVGQAAAQLRMIDEVLSDQGRLWMSVNTSLQQLRDPDLIERLMLTVRRHGINPARLMLEVTESALMSDVSANLQTLQRLRNAGFSLAMDEFGIGHSSLTYLGQLPVSVLKIEQSLVTCTDPEPHYAAVVEAIVSLAHRFHMSVVADGVDRPDQIGHLLSMGCDLGQGFEFSLPVEAHRLPETLLALDATR